MTDVILEAIRAIVLLGIVVFLWNSGRNRFEQFRKGWNLIITGFGLLLFGSVLDITDNFEALNPFIIIGDTEVEAFLEKFVGFLGGFLFLAIGLIKWIPGVQDLSDVVDERTRDLRDTNDKLTQEIHERKRAEKAKSEFTATVSHELRTPLTSIKGALGLALSGSTGQLPEKLKSMVEIAYSNSNRLILLINDILDMEKIEAERMEFNIGPMDIVPLVEEAVAANKGYGDEHGISFIIAEAEKQALVNGDRDRLMQVLSNLMSNAAKFSPDGDKVEISVTTSGANVRVSIKDNGPGIAAVYHDRIFEKFSQIDSSDARQTGGTGLGLSISKAIIKRHGGVIGLESEADAGSTFFFTLPILS